MTFQVLNYKYEKGFKASPCTLHPPSTSQAQEFQRNTRHYRTDRMEDLRLDGKFEGLELEGCEQLEGADRVFSSSISPVKSFSPQAND